MKKIVTYTGIVFISIAFLGLLFGSDTETQKDALVDAQMVIEEYDPIEDDEDIAEPEPNIASAPPVSVESENITPATTEITTATYYAVTDIVDGDTFRIDMDGVSTTLRPIGIDTPETVDPRKPVACFGHEATEKAKQLLENKKVRLEFDPSQGEKDIYGRLLVYVYTEDGIFFNKKMIEDGYAFEYTFRTPYAYQQEFKQAEQQAKNNHRGLWSPDTCNGEATSDTEPQTTPSQTSSIINYYTSSHHTAKYYYPVECSAWHGLSPSNLKGFGTLEELLHMYNRTPSPQC